MSEYITLKINNKNTKVGKYDDTYKVLTRISLENKDTLPNFFKLESTDLSLQEDQELVVQDIRPILKKFNQGSKDPQIVEKVIQLGLSFKLSKEDTICLWYLLSEFSLDDLVFETLGKFSRVFSDKNRFNSEIQKFKKKIETKRLLFAKKVESDDSLLKELMKFKKIETDPFDVDRMKLEYLASFDKNYSLIEIFNEIEVSPKIPFIVCESQSEGTFYKVYEDSKIDKKWYDPKDPRTMEGIYFWVLFFPKLYAKCHWKSNGIITIEYETKAAANSKDVIKNILYESLYDSKERLPGFTISEENQINVSGTFGIITSFNAYAMADFVSLNPLARRVLFINESGNTEPSKKNFHVYMELNQSGDQPKSLSFSIYSEEEGNYRRVRIKHCPDLLTANAGIEIFSRCMSLYKNSYDQIVAKYKAYSDAMNFFKEKKPKASKKENLKTGERLLALQKYNPRLFGSGYTSQCTKALQPYVVTVANPDDPEPEIVRELKKELGSDDKVMFFDGAYYACEGPGYEGLWPGLKPNKDVRTETTKFKEDFPWLPCCYKTSQYKSAKSPLNKYLSGLTAKKEAGDYIVGSTRLPVPDQKARMPLNLIRLAKIMKIEEVLKGKTSITYPYLRMGVEPSGDSFFHVLEFATNENYRLSKESKRQKIVDEAKKKLTKNFVMGKQEFYNYFQQEVERELSAPEIYLDPSKYFSLAEAHYKVNIVLYSIDEKNPDADFLFPRYTQAFLPKKRSTKLTVVIFRHQVINGRFPYQCELLWLEPNPTGGIGVFDKDEFVNKISNFYKNSLIVYSASEKGIWKY
jgi:hypothetical protein